METSIFVIINQSKHFVLHIFLGTSIHFNNIPKIGSRRQSSSHIYPQYLQKECENRKGVGGQWVLPMVMKLPLQMG